MTPLHFDDDDVLDDDFVLHLPPRSVSTLKCLDAKRFDALLAENAALKARLDAQQAVVDAARGYRDGMTSQKVLFAKLDTLDKLKGAPE